MKYIVVHDGRGRLRVQTPSKQITRQRADRLEYYLTQHPQVKEIRICRRIGSIVILYEGKKEDILMLLNEFSSKSLPAGQDLVPVNSSSHITEEYREQVAEQIVQQLVLFTLVPAPVRTVITGIQTVRFIFRAAKALLAGKIKTALLDSTALIVSMAQADYNTAAIHVFLMKICEILQKWIEATRSADLSQLMSLNVDYVWLDVNGQEIRTEANLVKNGDRVVVREGEMIPFDGFVTDGIGNVIESSFIGNALPVQKKHDSHVLAGTYLDEGRLVIRVQEKDGTSQYEKLMTLVDHTANLKSAYEVEAIRKADRMVPWMMGSGALMWAATRSLASASPFFMADYSYAVKLALPWELLRAHREAERKGIQEKGARFMELMAQADVIVFDKTGTLTKAQPQLDRIITFGSHSEDDVLRVAACMEEHFPHTLAKAITQAALEKGLEHHDMHTELENVVAHGIATTIRGKKVLLGSYHYVFEDENCNRIEGVEAYMDAGRDIGEQYLFLASDGEPEAVFCIRDGVKTEAAEVIARLRENGFTQVDLMTGDSALSTLEIARQLGVDRYFAECDPEDKAEHIRQLQEQGHTVVMVGDGVNDALALSTADVGIAMEGGSAVAKNVANVVIADNSLTSIIELRQICDKLTEKMHADYRTITASNAVLLAAGLTGILPVSITSALGDLVTIGVTLT